MDPQVEAVLKALAPFVAAQGSGGKNPKYKVTGFPSGTPSTPYYYGPNGLFGVDGLERDLISTRVQPRGISGLLPAYGSMVTNPLYPYLTGFLPASGSNPSGVCDDPKIAGAGKSCIQTAVFGRYTLATRELEVNRVGQQTDRGEFQDLTLMNDPFAEQLGGIFAQQFALGRQSAKMLGSEMLMRFLEVGVSFQNMLAPQVFVGNPDNNSAGGGYKEFPGLDILIGTNKKDALSGQACPSLNSDIKDFNYGLVDATNLNPDIVNMVTYMMRFLRHNASSMNFGEVSWVIAMREDLFYELTAVWPCSYLTYRCQFRTTDGTVVENVSATDQIAMRDAMRNGSYLIIDGKQYPVVIDDAIEEDSSSTTNKLTQSTYASDIYFIPLTVMGGRPVTYFEYLDYAQGALPAIEQGRAQSFFWSDGGRFLWHLQPPINWCIKHIAKIEPRLVLRTPHLAGRITNVAYRPLQHTRDAFPGQSYFVNGGVTTGHGAPSLYSDWNP
jgi:hypothetical protein